MNAFQLRARALFAAGVMVLCGLALPRAFAEGNETMAAVAAAGMAGTAVVSIVRWHQAEANPPCLRRPRR